MVFAFVTKDTIQITPVKRVSLVTLLVKPVQDLNITIVCPAETVLTHPTEFVDACQHNSSTFQHIPVRSAIRLVSGVVLLGHCARHADLAVLLWVVIVSILLMLIWLEGRYAILLA